MKFVYCLLTLLFALNDIKADPTDSLSLEKYLEIHTIKAEKTTDGMYYSTIEQGNGALPQSGDYLQIQFKTELLDGKVVDSSDAKVPFVFQLGYRYVIPCWDNLLGQFKTGSTIALYVPPQLAYGNSGYNGVVPPNASVIFTIKLEKILTASEYEASMRTVEDMARSEFKKRESLIFESDNKVIDAYVSDKKLKAERTPNGARVIVNKSGTGTKITNGQKVTVFYEGSFLNGKVFDSNMASKPFTFTVGEGKVIGGWEEGIQLLKNKAVGTFILPARAGYGATPLDDGKIIIPANSILVFKIEVIEVM